MKHLLLITLLTFLASPSWGEIDERSNLAVQVVSASELAKIYRNSNQVLVVGLKNA